MILICILTTRQRHIILPPPKKLILFAVNLTRLMGAERDELTGGGVETTERTSRIMSSRRTCWAGLGIRIGAKTKACRVFVGKPEGKRQVGRSGHRWVDNIKTDLREIGLGWYGLD
jgi:hypothetical protein